MAIFTLQPGFGYKPPAPPKPDGGPVSMSVPDPIGVSQPAPKPKPNPKPTNKPGSPFDSLGHRGDNFGYNPLGHRPAVAYPGYTPSPPVTPPPPSPIVGTPTAPNPGPGSVVNPTPGSKVGPSTAGPVSRGYSGSMGFNPVSNTKNPPTAGPVSRGYQGSMSFGPAPAPDKYGQSTGGALANAINTSINRSRSTRQSPLIFF